MDNLSASDVALLNRDGMDGFGNNGAFWILLCCFLPAAVLEDGVTMETM